MENTPDDISSDSEETLAREEGNPRPSTEEAREDPLVGKVIDEKYLVQKRLGGGGMGAVYKGKHMLMDREVAIKVLHTHLVLGQDREEFLARFRREAKTASKLNHPGAVTIHDFGIAEDLPYLVMEYNPGITLGSLLSERGALKISTILHIMKPICGALQAAHNLGIIHRDLKPDNVMVSKNSSGRRVVQVLDFGIAKITDQPQEESMTMTGTMIGTPYYMSPEQIRCENLDPRSDIYSLGVLLYQMLTGSLPFKGRSGTEVLLMHLTENPPTPTIEQPGASATAISQVVLKALEKNPDNRQQDVGQLYEELRLAVEDNIAPAAVNQNNSIIAAAVSGLFRRKKRSNSALINLLKVGTPLVILAALFVAGKKNPAPIAKLGARTNAPITSSTVIPTPAPKPTLAPKLGEQLKVEKNRLRILWHRLRTKREEVRTTLTLKQQQVESLEQKVLNSNAGDPLEKIRAELEIKRLELDAAKEHWRLHERNIFSEQVVSDLENREIKAEEVFLSNQPLQAKKLFAFVENKIVELLSKQNALLALSSNMLGANRSKTRFEIAARKKKASTAATEEQANKLLAQIRSDSEDGMFLEASERYQELEQLYDASRRKILKRAPKKQVRKPSDRERKIRLAEAEKKLQEVERQDLETRIKLDQYKKKTKKRTADAIDSGLKFLETIGSILD